MTSKQTEGAIKWAEPENVELRLDDDGVKRWYTSTRDGWQLCGHGGVTLELSAKHFNTGTRITLEEPIG
jgi:hypothetical protein